MDFEMTDVSTTNSPHKRNSFSYDEKNVERWFEEMDEIVNTEHFQLSDEQCPTLDVNDNQTIYKLREHINARMQKHNVHISTIKASASLITSKLMERLCVADMDHLKVEELKKSIEDARNYNNSLGIKQSRLQNELDFMKLRLQHFELEDEDRRERSDSEKRPNNKLGERNAQYEQQRKTLKRVAEIFDCPVPTVSSNVASLRKQFTENELRLSTSCSPKVSPFTPNKRGQLPKPFTQQNVLCRRPMQILSNNNNTPNLKHSSTESTEKSSESNVSSDSNTSPQVQRRSKSTGMFYQNSPYRSNSIFHKVAEHN